MEKQDEFQRSLAEQGRIFQDLVAAYGIIDDDRSRAGVTPAVYQRVLSGSLTEPLSSSIFDDLVRMIELKAPGFKETERFQTFLKTWRWTQRVFAQNGGRTRQSTGASLQQKSSQGKSESSQQFTQKKSATWILMMILKKLLMAGLISRSSFQQETGISRGMLEEMVRGEYRFSVKDDVLAGVAEFISPFLTEDESAVFFEALNKGSVFLSAEQTRIVCSPIEDSQERKRAAERFLEELLTPRESWLGKNREDVLEEIFADVETPGMLLGNLMSLSNLDASGLAVAAKCPTKLIIDTLRSLRPLPRKTATVACHVLGIDGERAVVFVETMATLQIPPKKQPEFFPPAIVGIGLREIVASWMKLNWQLVVFFRKVILCQVPALAPSFNGRGNGSSPFLLCAQCECADEAEDRGRGLDRIQFKAAVFSRLLRESRRERKLTQAELARKAGCSPQTISSAECGHTIPLGDYTLSMAKVLRLRGERRAEFLKAAGVS